MDETTSSSNDDSDSIKHEPETKGLDPQNQSYGGEHEENNQESNQTDDEAIDGLRQKIEEIQAGVGDPYDTGKEVLPDVPAYRESFRRAESLVEKVFTQAGCVLINSDYSDEFTQRLLSTIEDLKTPRYPEAKVLAFYGDSGVGKSSLINSVLDSPSLSAEGATGSACTCVITEYRNALESQRTPFKAEVEFYNSSVIDGMLKEHYANYFKYYVEQPTGVDGDDLLVMESYATTAKEIFGVLYAERPEFANTQLAKAFLSSGESETDEKILSQLSRWAFDLIRFQSRNTEVFSFTANSRSELTGTLEPFVEMKNNFDGASSWPLVRLVRVWLKSPLLARGLVIADLPGLSDTNRTRQRTTSQYLRSCAFTIIVAQVKRVLTDESTHRKLMIATSRPGKTKLLICTMIDKKDLTVATRATSVATSASACVEHEELFGLYTTEKQDNQQFRKHLKTLRGQERLDAQSEESSRDDEENAMKSMVLDSLVKLRNAKINRDIHNKYEEITEHARTLMVHFVSNSHYAKHLEGYERNDIPLPVSTTGIPQLRYCLSSIPAEDKLMVLTHHYKGNLRSVLDTMTIWASQTSLERLTELRKVVEKPRKVVGDMVEGHLREMRGIMKTVVMQPMGEATGEWEKRGLEKWEVWDKMRAASFSAWCRRDGVHETAAAPFRDWNQELLEAVMKTLKELWRRMKQSVTDCRELFSARLCKLVDDISVDLKAIPGVSILPMTPFLKSFTTKKGRILMNIEDFSKAWENAVTAAFDIATSSEHGGALMEAMLPIYQRLLDVKGKQQAKQRKALLRAAIDKGEPFSRIPSKIEEQFRTFFEKQIGNLSTCLTAVFDNVVNDYDLQSAVDETPNEDRDALKKDIKEYLEDAEATFNGAIAQEFARTLQPTRSNMV